jgi:hypothetical protein
MRAWWRIGRKIFVSYRRSDTREVAEQLYERLAKHFGAANVFMDRADIEYGQRWRDEVTRQIAAADMFIVLIGPAWLKSLRARAADEDVLRTELTSALAQKKQVIPVLVGGTTMPTASELPSEIRGLTEYQALSIGADNFDRAMLSLLGRVKPGWRLAVSWGFGQLFGWLAGLSIFLGALAAYGWMEGETRAGVAGRFPFIAGAFAGALAGGCVAAPQWLLLRPWFARARYLLPVYVVLTAIAAGYAASVQGDEASHMILGFMILLLPIVFALVLWWIVSENVAYAAWWAAANLLAPVIATLLAAAARSGDKAADASKDWSVSDALSVLSDFFLPMIVMSVATGVLLVWLMRKSEIRRR